MTLFTSHIVGAEKCDFAGCRQEGHPVCKPSHQNPLLEISRVGLSEKWPLKRYTCAYPIDVDNLDNIRFGLDFVISAIAVFT